MSLINQAVKNFDLEAWAISQGADGDGEELAIVCPTCGKEKLMINVERGAWHCWVCQDYRRDDRGKLRSVSGAGGVLDLLMLVEGISRDEARERVLEGATFSHQDIHALPVDDLKDFYINAFKPTFPIAFPEYVQPCTGILPYMQQRGITYEDALNYGLGFCTTGLYANRLIFPVWEKGQFVYFQARAMWEENQQDTNTRYIKALNPPKGSGCVSSDLLMNLDVACQYLRVALTEGPIDCIKAGPSAVCSFGKKISSVQISKLLRSGVKALDLMWDSDAIPEMERIAPLLSALFDVRIIKLPEGCDPGMFSHSQLNALRAQNAGNQVYRLERL